MESGRVAFAQATDFVVSGPHAHLNKFRAAVGERQNEKVRAVLGPGRRDEKAVVSLWRTVALTSHGINFEAGPQHAE